MQPQPDAKSSQDELIKPLAANTEGSYIVGGGLSGAIYLWEVNFLNFSVNTNCSFCLILAFKW